MIMRIADCSWIVGIVVWVLVATASGPAFAGPKHASCDSVTSSSICIDYTGSYWQNREKEMRLNCSGPKSKFRAEHCPAEPWDTLLIGTCVFGMYKPFETMARYYTTGGGGFDAPDFDFDWLRITCENTGSTWVWGPASGKGNP